MVTLTRERPRPDVPAGKRTLVRLVRPRRVAALAAVLTLGCAVLLARHVLQVRQELRGARTVAGTLHADLAAGNVAGVQEDVRLLGRRIDAADAGSNGLLWRAGSHLPLLGSQLQAGRGLTLALVELDRTSLVPAATALATLQAHPPVVNGAVDLTELSGLTPAVDGAVAGLASTQRMLAAIPSRHVLGSLRGARDTLSVAVARLGGSIDPLARVLHIAPAMLGADGTRTYLLATQNPAEARATGGLIAAYSIVTADHGRLTVVRSGTNTDFTEPLDPAATYDDLQAGGARRASAVQTFFAVNAEPDWGRAAATLTTLVRKQLGIHLDGVIGLTPQAIARVLSITGAVSLPDGTAVTADNAVRFVQVAEYQHFGSQTSARKSAIGDLAQLMVARLIHTRLSLPRIRSALRGSLGTGDIVVFSTHAGEEGVLRQTSVSGDLPASPSLVQVVDENTGGGKLDAYLRRSVVVARTGRADVTVTVVFTNVVRPADLTDYQASRLDDNRAFAPRGSARDLITLYGGVGASPGPVTLDGRPVAALVESDLGHPRISVDLELAPGRSATISFVLHAEQGRIRYQVQPLAIPEKLSIRN